MTGMIAVSGSISTRDASLIKAVVDGIMPEIREYFSDSVAPLIAANKALADRVAELEAREVTKPPVNVTEVEQMVVAAVAALPAADECKCLEPEEVKEMVATAVKEAVATIPPPKDGKSITAADIRPIVEESVSRAVASLPQPKDGTGLAGAIVDRDGNLVITLTDGKAVNLGQVVGRDADREEIARMVAAAVAAIPKPRDGKDGFDLRHFDVVATDDRTVEMSFEDEGGIRHTYELEFPVMIYRGVYAEGRDYRRGDCITWGGSTWHADKATTGKPDCGDWSLAVKRGRDGKSVTT